MDINLSDYYPYKVFSGREEGYKLRKQLNIDSLDRIDESVNIIIPDTNYCVTAGFILALFGDSIRYLGRDNFYKKYMFKCNIVIYKEIMHSLDYAIRDNTLIF